MTLEEQVEQFQKEVIREHGNDEIFIGPHYAFHDELKAFVEQIRNQALEEAAKVCESDDWHHVYCLEHYKGSGRGCSPDCPHSTALDLSDAIRSLKTNGSTTKEGGR